jgi:hypothetical protein
MTCTHCESKPINKNGEKYAGLPNYLCLNSVGACYGKPILCGSLTSLQILNCHQKNIEKQ